MKGLKIFALVLGSLLVLCALVVALALTPSVQTWATRKALAGQAGAGVEIGRVDAGFSSANLADVRLVREGAVITVKRISADYSAWDYLTDKRIDADRLVVEDLVIDLRHAGDTAGATDDGAAPAPRTGKTPSRQAKTPSQPFTGLLREAKLPFDIRLAHLAAHGRALLPEDKTVAFEIKGRDLQNGRQGSIDWQANLSDAQPDSPLRALHSNGRIAISITTDRRIEAITLDGTATAEGPQLPSDRLKLEARAAQSDARGSETYSATIGLLRDGGVDPLFKADGRFDAATQEIAGDWKLSVRTEQLAAVLAGLGLPEVAAQGTGKFNVNPATSAIAAQGEVQASVSRLEKVSPELAAIGALELRTSFDGGFDAGKARLERVQIDATGANGQRFAQIATVQRIEFDADTQRVALANPQSELARVAIQSLPLAWAQPFLSNLTIGGGDLSLSMAVEAEADGSRIRARTIEPLALRNVTLAADGEKLVEQVTLTARPRVDYSPAQLTAELSDLNVSMPAGDALTGNASAEITDLANEPTITFASQLQARVVSTLKPYLPLDPGPLSVAATVNGKLEGDTLHLAKFSSAVTRVDGPAVATVDLQQPLTADLGAQTFSLERPESPAARVKLGEVPLAWVQAFVPESRFGGNVAGGVLELTLPSLDNITVRTIEPFVARAVDAALEGEPMVQALDFAADFTATKRGETIAYEVRRVEFKQADASLATLTVAGEAQLGDTPKITAKGNLAADVAALMRQPVAAPFATLSQGRIESAFDANLADAIQAKLTLSARGLVAREGKRPLGDLNASVDLNLKSDSSGTLTAPITLANGQRRSDLAINATFGKQPDQDVFALNGNITSNQLFVDDFQPLAGIAPKDSTPPPADRRTPAPPAADLPSPARDNEPFWNAVRGKVAIDLKKIVYGKDYIISDVRGAATIADRRLALEGLEGRLKENPFKANGSLEFHSAQPQPYSLSAVAHVANFDLGEFLRAANPTQPPAIESKVTVDAKLNGQGATVGSLAKNAYGHFDISGTQGVLRALGNKTELASLGAGAVGLIGALSGSNTTAAIGEIAAAFAELKFDTFKLQVDRAADLNFKLSNIEFISPLMRTTGTGQVVNREGETVGEQPMQVVLQLGAKGALAQLLNKHGLLGQRTDDKGYQLLERQFNVGGTVAEPDANAFWKQLATELLRTKGLPALQNLFK